MAEAKPLEVAEIRVDKKGHKEGQRNGWVKVGDIFYGCPLGLLKDFQEGETYKIEYRVGSAKKDGGNWLYITKNIGGGNGANAPKQNVRQRMDPADARGAFVTVILEGFVRAGKVALNRDAIALARQEIAAGYDMSHNPQRRDDMSDEIPY